MPPVDRRRAGGPPGVAAGSWRRRRACGRRLRAGRSAAHHVRRAPVPVRHSRRPRARRTPSGRRGALALGRGRRRPAPGAPRPRGRRAPASAPVVAGDPRRGDRAPGVPACQSVARRRRWAVLRGRETRPRWSGSLGTAPRARWGRALCVGLSIIRRTVMKSGAPEGVLRILRVACPRFSAKSPLPRWPAPASDGLTCSASSRDCRRPRSEQSVATARRTSYRCRRLVTHVHAMALEPPQAALLV